MGSLLSKNKVSPKVVPVLEGGRITSSAPAQLERLEGTSPRASPAPSLRTRAITPPETSSTPPTAPKDRSAATESSKALPPRSVSKCQSLQESRPAALSVPDAPAPASPKPAAAADEVAGPATPSDGAPTATTPQGKRGPKKIDVIGDQSDGKKLAADLPAAIGIPEEAQAWTKVYGESIIRNFHSSDWKDREQSLASIQRSLGTSKFLAGKDPNTVYSVTAEMLAKTLKDKVAPIFHSSLELVSVLLASYASSVPKQVLHSALDPIMPIIIHRCGNLNTRIHEASLQTLVAIANFPSFGCSYVGPFALSELPKRNRDASQAAQMYGRLDLVASLLSTYKTHEGLAVADVMRFCKTGLEMPDEKVRQAAIRAIGELYKLQKAAGGELAVEKYLGPVKPALMQVLQKRFTEADGELAGAPATATASREAAPAASNGIKVFGKSLPPLKGAPAMQLVGQGMSIKPGTPDAAGPGSARPSPLGPGSRTRTPPLSGAAKRERPRMVSGAPASPATPSTPPAGGKGRSPLGANLPDLQVPKYTQQLIGSPSAPSRGGGSRGSARTGTPGTPGALDDAEENLLQYIMGDMK